MRAVESLFLSVKKTMIKIRQFYESFLLILYTVFIIGININFIVIL